MRPPADDLDIFPDDGSTDLIEAAERKRGRRAMRDAPAGLPRPAPFENPPTKPRRQRSSDHLDASEAPGEDSAIERKIPRRRAKPADEADLKPGLVTRGVHVGLDGAQMTASGLRQLGPWTVAALILALGVVGVSVYATTQAPQPLPVVGLRVNYLPGPQLAEREVRVWLAHFPHRDKLVTGDAWMLDRLAHYLRSIPAVATVKRVEAVHEPQPNGHQQMVRTLVLDLGLRQPEMPAVLSTGERVWLAADGRILPGSLPAPATRRPVVHALERGGLGTIYEVLALWRELEPMLEQGLVTDIHLDDALDQSGHQRGVVLYTRQGTRLIWGRPGDERFGVYRAQKINDLVRTIRCQGDLRRIALINVRFAQPFFVLRSADPTSPPPVIRSTPAQPRPGPTSCPDQRESPRIAGNDRMLFAAL